MMLPRRGASAVVANVFLGVPENLGQGSLLSLVPIRISEGPLKPGSLVSHPGQTTLKWIPKQMRDQAPAPCSEQHAQ